MKLLSKILIVVFLIGTQLLSAQQNGFDAKKKQGFRGNSPSNVIKLGDRNVSVNTKANIVRHPDLGMISLDLELDAETGLPLWVKKYPKPKAASFKTADSRFEAAKAFVSTLPGYDKMLLENHELSLSEETTDNLGHHHLRMQWYKDGIKMYGSDLTIHLKNDLLSCLGRNYVVIKEVKEDALLDVDLAVSSCRSDLQSRGKFVEFTERDLEFYPQGQFVSELVWHKNPETKEVNLVWHISARPNFTMHHEYFIDAYNAEILFEYNHTCNGGLATANASDLNGDTRFINTYDDDNAFFLYDASRAMYVGNTSVTPEVGDGVIVTLDMGNSGIDDPSYDDVTSSNNSWNNPTAVSAHFNAGEAYEYFRQTHGRNSINGQGGDILSFINVADDDGGSLENAFWNGQYMFYGNGGQAIGPLAGALDVGGHEMSHGVIQNTANLEYYSEPGAINESMADIFGAMIDRDDWKMGEDIVNTNVFPTGALRDLSNPNNGGNSLSDIGYQPDHVSDKFNGSEDNAGVHINSGIPNLAFFNIATDIGKEKAEKIYYRALSQYLTKSSRFVDLRAAVEMASEDLYGASELTAVENGFAAVGIGGGGSTNGENYQENISLNEGDQFIIIHNTDPNFDDLLQIDVQQQAFTASLSSTDVLRPPSVTDDGQWLYFVGTDKTMRRVNLGSLNEEVLFEQFAFDNVAISKDGTKIAALSTEREPFIYFHELSAPDDVWIKVELYNPTYSDGVDLGGVQYADALEWDLAGENVLYDAFNSFNNSSGVEVAYWDVGVLNVWDNSTNNWTQGKIEKVYSNLPAGVSIGNATYSKNSPHIIAFDFLDTEATDIFGNTFNQYVVVGGNTETGEVNQIFGNSTLGFPNFSVDDTQLLFTTAENGSEDVAIINLGADKISAVGDPNSFVDDADWPLWYANGERVLSSGLEDLLPNSKQLDIAVKIAPSLFDNQFSWTLEEEHPEDFKFMVVDIQGKRLLEGVCSDNNIARTEKWSTGSYFLLVFNAEGYRSMKLVKGEN